MENGVYPKLFKKKTLKNGADKMNVWSIRVDEDDRGRVFIVREWGIEGGKMTSRVTEITAGKNIGRSNETSKLEQAHKEAAAFWKDYVEKKEYTAARSAALTSVSNIPMTAYVLEDVKKLEGKEVYLQIKYDGVRALSNVDKDGVLTIRSRTDSETYVVPHIAGEITPVLKLMGPNFHLDGELVSDEYKLWEFAGALRNDKPETVVKVINSLYYVVYDCYDHSQPGLKYVLRYSKLQQYFGKMRNVIVVENYETNSSEEIKNYFEQAISDGEEGIMIRDPNCPYEHKRSKCLLKMKGVEEAEFYIKDIVPAEKEPGGIFELFAENGEVFSVRPSGTVDDRIKLLEQRESMKGKKVTVVYATRTDKDIPFHPRIKQVFFKGA